MPKDVQICFVLRSSEAQVMLNTVGRVLEEAHWLVRGVAFDGHGSNAFVREALQGSFVGLKAESLRDIPFFKRLVYRNLPQHSLPRMPLRLATCQGRAIWPLCGPCALPNIHLSLSNPVHTYS